MDIDAKEFECRKLTQSMCLPFQWRTDNLGRAEFSICAKYRYGKLVKMTIYPLQQENIDFYYEWEGSKRNFFTLNGYDGLERPHAWFHSYCKEHKCQSMRVYVPTDAKYLWFDLIGEHIGIGFTKINVEKKTSPW